MPRFINRSNERKEISKLIENNTRISIIWSNTGAGKTCLIEEVFKNKNIKTYIPINSNELLDSDVPENYYINQIANKVFYMFNCSNVSKNNFFSNTESNVSVSVSVGFIGLSWDIPQNCRSAIKELLYLINQTGKRIYIHIEDTQKIDSKSMCYIMQLVNESNYVNLFLECHINYYKIIEENFSKKLKVNVHNLSIGSLEWDHVVSILSDLQISINDAMKEEYEESRGNIKNLILNSQIPNKQIISISLDDEQLLILNMIILVCSRITYLEIYNILKSYKNTANMFTLRDLQTILSDLCDCDLIIENENKSYRPTRFCDNYIDETKISIIISALSNYYVPIISRNENSIQFISGMHILINTYIKYNDDRIHKLLPYIESNLYCLNLSKEDINLIYSFVKTSENIQSLIYVIRIYMHLEYYDIAKNIIQDLIPYDNTDTLQILYATILIHLDPSNTKTINYITNIIKRTKNSKLKSAMYTCLISLYMKCETATTMLDFIKTLNPKELTELDFNIINKNISIYYDYVTAKTMLMDSSKYFDTAKLNRLTIATKITLATRHTQAGSLKEAENTLAEINSSEVLSHKDIIYIDNNSAVIKLLNNDLSIRHTLNNFRRAYIFCKDEYTHLLGANNILIYYTKNKDFENAQLYADELEKVGFIKYKFDEYLHLTYLNLLYYYARINNNNKIELYIKKLQQLKEICYSKDLKRYIESNLTNKPLSENDRWYFFSKFKYRPAFMGHWIVNNFDS